MSILLKSSLYCNVIYFSHQKGKVGDLCFICIFSSTVRKGLGQVRPPVKRCLSFFRSLSLVLVVCAGE
jgi:hypothetical protein